MQMRYKISSHRVHNSGSIVHKNVIQRLVQVVSQCAIEEKWWSASNTQDVNNGLGGQR